MPWTALSATTTPLFPSEEWRGVDLPAVEGLKLYAFKLVGSGNEPLNWNTQGFWGLGQRLDDRDVIGRTYPIPYVGRNAAQALVMIGASGVDFIIQDPLQVKLYYSVHRWVTRSTLYLYGYS
jgi:hypothetical protein